TPPPPRHSLPLHDALPIFAGTRTNSAHAPSVRATPMPFQFSQRLKRPARHWRHVPSYSVGSTATKSPTLTLRTSAPIATTSPQRSEEHTSELQSRENLVCR